MVNDKERWGVKERRVAAYRASHIHHRSISTEGGIQDGGRDAAYSASHIYHTSIYTQGGRMEEDCI